MRARDEITDGCPALERGLRRPVPAPTLIGLDGGIGGDVDDDATIGESRQHELRERERGEHVHAVHAFELRERIALE